MKRWLANLWYRDEPGFLFVAVSFLFNPRGYLRDRALSKAYERYGEVPPHRKGGQGNLRNDEWCV